MDKLAEEILQTNLGKWYYENKLELKLWVIKAMQSYHEEKLKDITDVDIEAWAKEKYYGEAFDAVCIDACIDGAKALLNGEIKHCENG